MAYKVFSNGDALTGGELNTFLMNQSVISFATTTARDAALTAPLEGQLVWLEDSNKYVYYTGSAWTDLIVPGSSGNAIINGAFDIWQRGTTIGPLSSTTTYVADRWYAYLGATPFTYSRQTTGLDGIQFGMRMQRTSGNTGTNTSFVVTAMETVNSIPFAGRTVTLSFYARAGANYSAASLGLNAILKSGTGVDQKHDVYTGGVDLINQNAILTTSWQRFTYTATVGTTATELAVLFATTPVGTAGANDWFEVTGVQLEASSTATTFRRNAPSIQGELAACQRYYWRSGLTQSTLYAVAGIGHAHTSTKIISYSKFPVNLRISPTSVEWANAVFSDGVNANITFTTLTLDVGFSSGDAGVSHATVSGATAFRPYWLHGNNNISGYVAYSAEL